VSNAGRAAMLQSPARPEIAEAYARPSDKDRRAHGKLGSIAAAFAHLLGKAGSESARTADTKPTLPGSGEPLAAQKENTTTAIYTALFHDHATMAPAPAAPQAPSPVVSRDVPAGADAAPVAPDVHALPDAKSATVSREAHRSLAPSMKTGPSAEAPPPPKNAPHAPPLPAMVARADDNRSGTSKGALSSDSALPQPSDATAEPSVSQARTPSCVASTAVGAKSTLQILSERVHATPETPDAPKPALPAFPSAEGRTALPDLEAPAATMPAQPGAKSPVPALSDSGEAPSPPDTPVATPASSTAASSSPAVPEAAPTSHNTARAVYAVAQFARAAGTGNATTLELPRRAPHALSVGTRAALGQSQAGPQTPQTTPQTTPALNAPVPREQPSPSYRRQALAAEPTSPTPAQSSAHAQQGPAPTFQTATLPAQMGAVRVPSENTRPSASTPKHDRPPRSATAGAPSEPGLSYPTPPPVQPSAILAARTSAATPPRIQPSAVLAARTSAAPGNDVTFAAPESDAKRAADPPLSTAPPRQPASPRATPAPSHPGNAPVTLAAVSDRRPRTSQHAPHLGDAAEAPQSTHPQLSRSHFGSGEMLSNLAQARTDTVSTVKQSDAPPQPPRQNGDLAMVPAESAASEPPQPAPASAAAEEPKLSSGRAPFHVAVTPPTPPLRKPSVPQAPTSYTHSAHRFNQQAVSPSTQDGSHVGTPGPQTAPEVVARDQQGTSAVAVSADPRSALSSPANSQLPDRLPPPQPAVLTAKPHAVEHPSTASTRQMPLSSPLHPASLSSRGSADDPQNSNPEIPTILISTNAEAHPRRPDSGKSHTDARQPVSSAQTPSSGANLLPSETAPGLAAPPPVNPNPKTSTVGHRDLPNQPRGEATRSEPSSAEDDLLGTAEKPTARPSDVDSPKDTPTRAAGGESSSVNVTSTPPFPAAMPPATPVKPATPSPVASRADFQSVAERGHSADAPRTKPAPTGPAALAHDKSQSAASGPSHPTATAETPPPSLSTTESSSSPDTHQPSLPHPPSVDSADPDTRDKTRPRQNRVASHAAPAQQDKSQVAASVPVDKVVDPALPPAPRADDSVAALPLPPPHQLDHRSPKADFQPATVGKAATDSPAAHSQTAAPASPAAPPAQPSVPVVNHSLLQPPPIMPAALSNPDAVVPAAPQIAVLSAHSAPLFQQAAEDPGLAVAVLPHAAHASLVSNAGDLSLHVRVRDGNADVNLGGSMAPMFESKASEVRTVLAGQGITLGSFATDQQGSQHHSQQSAETTPNDSHPHAAPARRQTTLSSPEATINDQGRIHITA